jgi:hypothetical protein
MSNLSAKMPDVIKTISIDNTVRQYSEDESSQQKEVNNQIVEIITDMIVVNPACRRMYGRKDQRAAVQDLLKDYGFDLVKNVIKLLPKTNKKAFLPTITTPVQLRDKWSQLESGLSKLKDQGSSQRKGMSISMS